MFIAMLLAAEKEAPLIDIDGTVFVQLAIFLVVMGVLYALVFKPYLELRDRREQGIGGARDEAKAMESKAGSLGADYEAQVARARQKGAEERNRMRAEAVAHEQQVLGEARAVAQKEIDAARASAATGRETARAALAADVDRIAHQVAGRILGRQV